MNQSASWGYRRNLQSNAAGLLLTVLLLLSTNALPQAPAAGSTVPTLVNFSGAITDLNGKPMNGIHGVTFYLYKDSEGGAPLWMETQNVQVDSRGHYTVRLGSTTSQGLPKDLFASGEARWLAVQPEGQAEQPRVLLLSVPYALKAADAETIGGLPPSAFVLAAPAVCNGASVDNTAAPSAAAVLPPATSSVTTTGGTVNALPLFTTATNIQNSILTQTGTTAVNVAGKLNLPATGTATATGGKNSRPESFVASAFNSSTSAAVNQTFQWQAEAAGNNTATESGTLNLLFGAGTTAPAETGLKLSSKGVFTFATGQTFPGTGTITGVTAGTDLTGGGTSGKVMLNLNTTATDARYARLGASNSFTGNVTVSGNVTATGTVSGNLGSFTGNSSNSILNVIQNATSGPGFAVAGTSYDANPHQAALLGQELASGADVFGVEGFVFGPSGAGVYGQNNNPQSSVGASIAGGAGVWGDSGSAGATGVLATATNTNSVLALNNSGVSTAILAENQNTTSGTSSLAPAVVGFSFAPQGLAVVGSGPVHSNSFTKEIGFEPFGVVGDSKTGVGVGGFSDAGNAVTGVTGSGNGVFGVSSAGVGVVGNSSANNGVEGDSSSGYGVFGSSAGGTGIVGETAMPQPYAGGSFVTTSSQYGYGLTAGGVVKYCYIDNEGNIVCSGSKSAAVPLPDNRWVKLYAVESPENWFEDFGSGQLSAGSAVIALEPTFAATVNSNADYHVFLTPNGNSQGLYVASKTATSFEVREQGGGKSNISFDYRIVARRIGYENIRMEDVTEMHNRTVALRQEMVKHPLRKEPLTKSTGGPSVRQMQMPIPPHTTGVLRPNLPALPAVRPAPASATKR